MHAPDIIEHHDNGNFFRILEGRYGLPIQFSHAQLSHCAKIDAIGHSVYFKKTLQEQNNTLAETDIMKRNHTLTISALLIITISGCSKCNPTSTTLMGNWSRSGDFDGFARSDPSGYASWLAFKFGWRIGL